MMPHDHRTPGPEAITLPTPEPAPAMSSADLRANGAACRDTDPELFFGGRDAVRLHNAAKQVCASCPVRAACLERALAVPEEHGVFGGHTARERAEIRRTRNMRIRRGTVSNRPTAKRNTVRTYRRGNLSDDDVAKIRAGLSAGVPAVELAARFVVSPSSISRIKNGSRHR